VHFELSVAPVLKGLAEFDSKFLQIVAKLRQANEAVGNELTKIADKVTQSVTKTFDSLTKANENLLGKLRSEIAKMRGDLENAPKMRADARDQFTNDQVDRGIERAKDAKQMAEAINIAEGHMANLVNQMNAAASNGDLETIKQKFDAINQIIDKVSNIQGVNPDAALRQNLDNFIEATKRAEDAIEKTLENQLKIRQEFENTQEALNELYKSIADFTKRGGEVFDTMGNLTEKYKNNV